MLPLSFQVFLGKRLDGQLRGELEPLPDGTVIGEHVIPLRIAGFTQRSVENRAIDAVVIDSYPALVADQEDEAGMDNMQPGVAARINNKMYRKAGSKSRRSMTSEDRDILLLSINQWRSKIGVMFGDPRTTPGGQGKDYASFIRVEVSRDGWLEQDGHKVGQTIKTKCIKNKSAPASMRCANSSENPICKPMEFAP